MALRVNHATKSTGQLPRIAIALAAVVALWALMVALTPAHGDGGTKSAIALQKLAEATPVPTVTLPSGGTHYEGVGIDVTSAPSGAKATVTAQAALILMLKNQGLDLSLKPQTEVLMLATDGDFGLPEQKNTFVDRLSWIMTFVSVAPDVRGPSMTDAEHQQIVDSVTCKNTGVVDANSGDALAYFQICEHR